MCTSKPKTPAPIPMAPNVGPESIDDAALVERDRELRRNRARSGRSSTILAGSAGTPPTLPVKTALGA